MGLLISFQNFNKHGFLLFKAATLIFLYFILSFSNNLNCATRYVSKTGSSTEPYTSWATAADSIQKCIDFSQSGDTIYVANGSYKEKIVMIKGLTLIGAGTDSCIIDTRELVTPTNFYAVIISDSCIVQGFHIIVSPAANQYDGSAFVTDYPIVEIGKGVIIENNKVSQAGYGISTFGSYELEIKNNHLVEVEWGIAYRGFGNRQKLEIENNVIVLAENLPVVAISNVFVPPYARIINNIIITNDKGKGIIATSQDSFFVANNLIYHEGSKQAVIGFGITNGKARLHNNTFYGDFGYDGSIFVEDNHDIRNNIVAASERGIFARWPVPNINFKYNNVWNCEIPYVGMTPDSTNYSVDPMFVNEDSIDFHLQMFSPMIDAGDPNILDADGSRSDLGMYGGPLGESYTYQDLAPKPPRNLTAQLQKLTVKLNWLSNTEADFYKYRVYRDTVSNFVCDTTKIIAEIADSSFSETVTNGRNLYYKVTAIDSQYNQSPPSEEAAIILVGVKEPELKANDYKLYPNYPNPFNPSTMLSYRLKSPGNVRLAVYDVKGEMITELVNEYQSEGYYEKLFDAKAMNLSSGVYLFRIEVKNENNIPVFTDMRKSILVK